MQYILCSQDFKLSNTNEEHSVFEGNEHNLPSLRILCIDHTEGFRLQIDDKLCPRHRVVIIEKRQAMTVNEYMRPAKKEVCSQLRLRRY